MATISAVVLKHHKKPNGNFPAKFRITQHGKSVYIDTGIEVSKTYVDRNFNIKKAYSDKIFSSTLARYWSYITPEIASSYSAHRIKDIIIDSENPHTITTSLQIDFIKFCEEFVFNLEKEGRKSTAIPFKTLLYSLQDYARSITPCDITSNWLKAYEAYLRKPKVLRRKNQHGVIASIKTEGLSDAGVAKHLSNLRTAFNACADKYNDYDTGNIIISNKPFFRYKIKSARIEKVRHLEIPDLIKLYKAPPADDLEKQSKDMFFLSFFLCGMNSVDFYHYLGVAETGGRLNYNRSKTKGGRDDKAFFSVKVPKCAKEMLSHYKNGVKSWYSNERVFNKSLNKGLKRLASRAGLETLPTFYFARHTFATIARNECDFDVDRVASALNHSSQHLITDRYIAKDWSKVDEVQSKVLSFFFDKLDNSLQL